MSVFLNDRRVGTLTKETSGAINFAYEPAWIEVEGAIPVSLSLPLQERSYTGERVSAVFDNLLPDSQPILRRVAERVGASSTGAYDMLAQIGRDCVGALQFVPEGTEPTPTTRIEAEPVDDEQIANLIANLSRAPLGLDANDEFRISVAGAQEKTALLFHEGRWHRPHGTTPTTHIIKPAIGVLPNGIDLSHSVENEWYCLRLMRELGLPVATATIETFGATRALAVERFDRRMTTDGRLLRLPHEDCCQALGVPPTRKYENEGGPGVVDIMKLLQGSDDPNGDRETFFFAVVAFWLIGATDGHAKNFGLLLRPGSSYVLAPLYDVLTAQPSLADRQIDRKQFRLAMRFGRNRYYRLDKILERHVVETGRQAGFSERRARAVVRKVAGALVPALERMGEQLPSEFPASIHQTVADGALGRLRAIT